MASDIISAVALLPLTLPPLASLYLQECTYVASNITEVPFFSSKVKLGKNGEHATYRSYRCILGSSARLSGMWRAERGGAAASPLCALVCQIHDLDQLSSWLANAKRGADLRPGLPL